MSVGQGLISESRVVAAVPIHMTTAISTPTNLNKILNYKLPLLNSVHEAEVPMFIHSVGHRNQALSTLRCIGYFMNDANSIIH